MKFIHLANVYLNSVPVELKGIRIDRTKEYRTDFLKVLDVCREQNIDMLFITGGLFRKNPEEEDLADLNRRFSELTNTRVFILTGKTDTPDMTEALKNYAWNSNTLVLSGNCIERIYVSRLNAEITGVGYDASTWSRVRLTDLRRGKKGAIQLLILPFIGADPEDELPQDLAELPFDYVGIGQKRLLNFNMEKRISSPGLFEPEGFSEQIGHGYVMGDLKENPQEAGQTDIRFVQSAGREYITLQVNANESLEYETVEQRIRESISRYGSESIYRIVLDGTATPSLCFMKERLYGLGHVTEIEDRTDREASLRMLDGTATGEAINRLMKLEMPDADPEIKEMAIQYGIDALFAVRNGKPEDNQ